MEPKGSRAVRRHFMIMSTFTLAAVGMMAPAARATFPGVNGRIAFFRDVADGSAQIFTMNSDGSDQVQITGLDPGEGTNIYPDWSPDGTKIAFDSDRDGDREIFVMDADGSNQVQLTFNTNTDRNPSWSPDGTRLVYSSNLDGDRDIWMIDVATLALTQITNGPGTDIVAQLSPDGQVVSFTRTSGNHSSLYTINIDGTNQRRLTRSFFDGMNRDWAPAGTEISLVDNACVTCDESDLFVIAPDGRRPIQLTDTPENELDPAFSPDGTHIVFTRADLIDDVLGPRDIYVMNADGSGVTNVTNTPDVDDAYPDWGSG
jgi:Tol biopolymer transport system component